MLRTIKKGTIYHCHHLHFSMFYRHSKQNSFLFVYYFSLDRSSLCVALQGSVSKHIFDSFCVMLYSMKGARKSINIKIPRASSAVRNFFDQWLLVLTKSTFCWSQVTSQRLFYLKSMVSNYSKRTSVIRWYTLTKRFENTTCGE